MTWLGRPVWQNLADIWTVQETLVEREVDMVVECGTNRGGSAFFMASVLDLLGRGRVLTIDVVDQAGVDHPRIEFLIGSSTDPGVVAEVHRRVAEHSPRHVLVLLDSDHSEKHVLEELRAYNDLVGVGDYIVVQDGVIDELRMLRADRPGPLPAIERFLHEDPRFEVDEERSSRFLFNHSPRGWLRRAR